MTEWIPQIVALHLAATWALTGLIWTVQWVHYPLFLRVGDATFRNYHAQHMRRMTHVVAPLMLVELASAVVLVSAKSTLSPWIAWSNLALLAVIWLSTALIQVPQHNRLGDTGHEDTIRALVRGNWIRTAAWTIRSTLLLSTLFAAP